MGLSVGRHQRPNFLATIAAELVRHAAAPLAVRVRRTSGAPANVLAALDVVPILGDEAAKQVAEFRFASHAWDGQGACRITALDSLGVIVGSGFELDGQPDLGPAALTPAGEAVADVFAARGIYPAPTTCDRIGTEVITATLAGGSMSRCVATVAAVARRWEGARPGRVLCSQVVEAVWVAAGMLRRVA